MSARALPFVCAWCGRVRTSAGRWERREASASGSEATHGICPECLAEVEQAAALDGAVAPAVIRAGARPLP